MIDDYAHHPTEVRATLAAARRGAWGRVVAVFQPHRYTRTRDCFEDFVKVIGTADAVLLAEVYAAGEAPIVAADGRSLARAVRIAGKVEPLFVEKSTEMREAVLSRLRDGDVVLTMGAGSIGHLAPERVPNASGLFNLMRNLGGAIGLARGGTLAELAASLPRLPQVMLNSAVRHRDSWELDPVFAGAVADAGRSASSIIRSAERSLALPPGFIISSFAQISRSERSAKNRPGAVHSRVAPCT